MMNLLHYIEDSISNFGKSGDRSLEYIGVIVNDQSIKEVRTYRKRCSSTITYLKATEPYNTAESNLLNQFINHSEIRLCDISEESSGTQKCYRMIYKLPYNLATEVAAIYINDFFIHSDVLVYKERVLSEIAEFQVNNKCRYFPLMQIGIDVDSRCCLTGIKYYLRFEKENGICNHKQVLGYCESKGLSTRQRNVINEITRNDYTPIFVGINDRAGLIENKLYFISQAFGYQINNIVPSTADILKRLEVEKAFPSNFVRDVFNMGVYIQGIAMSINCPNEWRFYLTGLPMREI